MNTHSVEEFKIGQEWEYGGLFYRIIGGDRCDGDMIIEFSQDRIKWHRPHLAHAAILICFKFQVEENNYGSSGKIKKGEGGFYLLRKLREACTDWGWRWLADEIAHQRSKLKNRNGNEGYRLPGL